VFFGVYVVLKGVLDRCFGVFEQRLHRREVFVDAERFQHREGGNKKEKEK